MGEIRLPFGASMFSDVIFMEIETERNNLEPKCNSYPTRTYVQLYVRH